jgi:hypothetical protein
MAESRTPKAALLLSSRALLVQDTDGTVYSFDGAVLDACRKRGLTRAQKAQTKRLFDTLRKEKRLVDAAFLPIFHIFEGAG